MRARVATAGIVARPYGGQCRTFLDVSGRMGRRHRPRPYDGPALLLAVRDRNRSELVDASPLLTGEVQAFEVPGTHDTMVEEPNVTTLARLLGDALDVADPLRGG